MKKILKNQLLEKIASNWVLFIIFCLLIFESLGVFVFRVKFYILFVLYIFTDNVLSSGPFSPSNFDPGVQPKQEFEVTPKRRIIKTSQSPTRDSVLTIKAEPQWEVDSIIPSMMSDRRSEMEFSIEMEARQILRLCK